MDIVVSNSGLEHFAKIKDVTAEAIGCVDAVNTHGQFLVAQQAYKHLQSEVSFILLPTISAQAKRVKNHAVYSGSKAAVKAFARWFTTGM